MQLTTNPGSIRILHVEDDPSVAHIVDHRLHRAGLACSLYRVDSREAFQDALEHKDFDLVLSDHSMPGFDGITALKLTRLRKPGLPFVFLSGTIGKSAKTPWELGANGWVSKDRLEELVPSICRALENSRERRDWPVPHPIDNFGNKPVAIVGRRGKVSYASPALQALFAKDDQASETLWVCEEDQPA